LNQSLRDIYRRKLVFPVLSNESKTAGKSVLSKGRPSKIGFNSEEPYRSPDETARLERRDSLPLMKENGQVAPQRRERKRQSIDCMESLKHQ
jgi:hypothetical protein